MPLHDLDSLTLQSPAKLNLMLHVTGRRPDGYHELQTAFQFIALHDELELTRRDDNQLRRIGGDPSIAPEQDLVLRAARLLQRHAGSHSGADIRLEKRIPVGGGLGGGSSDAAAVLMGLNRLWGLGLDRDQLMRLGLELGADVPVFIFGRSAWAEGVGERLQPLDLPEPVYLVIHPGVFVSTAEIFAAKDLTRDCAPITIRAFLEGRGRNVCEPVAVGRHPEIAEALRWLGERAEARMTGTGACIYAAFPDRASAEAAREQVPGHWSAFVARGSNINPVARQCFPADFSGS
jgi:4-diphosphocytidyl-2-C-methyl-D-erythritol kinase